MPPAPCRTVPAASASAWDRLSIELQEHIFAQISLVDQAHLRAVSRDTRRVIDAAPALAWNTARTVRCLQRLPQGPDGWARFVTEMGRHRAVVPHLTRLALPLAVAPNDVQLHAWLGQLRTQICGLRDLRLTHLDVRNLRPAPLTALRSLEIGYARTLRHLHLELPNLSELSVQICPLLQTVTGRLPRLFRCDLADCQSLQSMPWQQLAALQVLHLRHAASLAQVDLRQMAQLSTFNLVSMYALRHIRLAGNAQLGSLYLAHFHQLRCLDIENCRQLRSVELFDCAEVREVRLEGCLALRRLSLRWCPLVDRLVLLGLKRLDEVALFGSSGLGHLEIRSAFSLAALALVWQRQLRTLLLASCPRLCSLHGYSPYVRVPTEAWQVRDCPALVLRGGPLQAPWLATLAPGPCHRAWD